ncbi:MFS transporter, partial [Acinetobacter baumannii]
RWTELYRDTPLLGTAFAFESVADELVYIVGSVLSVGLSVTFFPQAGILVSTLALAVGTTLFAAQKSTEPKVQPVARRKGRSAIALRPVQL